MRVNVRVGATLLLGFALLAAAPKGLSAQGGQPSPHDHDGHGVPRPQELSPKESFMLMFGKGNGAMRVLCALEKEGLIDQATRKRWILQLDGLLSERGDTELDRRNTRIGMAFADARASLCPSKVMGRTNP